MKPMESAEGYDLLEAMLSSMDGHNEPGEDTLVPKMWLSFLAIQVWDRLTEEERIKAVWFHDDDVPDTPGKRYYINPFGYYFNA